MVKTNPKGAVEVTVHNSTLLKCHAEGNPPPKYQWIQSLAMNRESIRSYTAEMVIENAVYGDQGDYKCVAINRIGGERRELESDFVRVEVIGSPVSVKGVGEVVGIHGTDVRLDAEFCSDPIPSESSWEWGDVTLPTGSELKGRFKAELESHPHMEDCYISRLTVSRATMEDSMEYRLKLGNKHGQDILPVTLRIRAPLPLSPVFFLSSIFLLVVVLLLIFCVFLRRKNLLCWKEKLVEKEGNLGGNSFNRGDSKLSLVKETVNPPTTKV